MKHERFDNVISATSRRTAPSVLVAFLAAPRYCVAGCMCRAVVGRRHQYSACFCGCRAKLCLRANPCALGVWVTRSTEDQASVNGDRRLEARYGVIQLSPRIASQVFVVGPMRRLDHEDPAIEISLID